ncbi:CDP-glycerol glycerophosphotransferase family protein [Vibrio aquimaris]|uniref:CDP-Glycerol:Poly(Glycerophosphate) glycerophosphotransferase n=1 Tax=Vibrio aquimaris TaxID=2587862 RepID=A0A5P9CF90_9VIBR|nr:CDP-glycerol glycerophosphotransferase family protein [Vibrio aquimaris]QFT24874.1 CDP-Glycerol:Poly(glycerophosphate) glycerophosphotransferase [Vibrio aquimaris]
MSKFLYSIYDLVKGTYIDRRKVKIRKQCEEFKYSKYDVAFYMSGGYDSIYQYNVWKCIISEMLSRGIRVVTIHRSISTYTHCKHVGECKFLSFDLDDLIGFYASKGVKVILYPNNRMKNFQSLSYNGATHVFINHGESEKSSMFSNQAKAYDYVFVAGELAKERYIRHVANIDERKLIKVGRPQLDFIETAKLEIPKNKKVVLYAPTWEGTHQEMNYSSIGEDAYEMVSKFIANENYFLLYKPHPSLGSKSTIHKKYHRKIIDLVDKEKNSLFFNGININALYCYVDFAIFDNSSVIIDYLSTEKPYVIVDRFYVDRNEHVPEMAKGNNILVNENELYSLPLTIPDLIRGHDLERARSKRLLYLGDLSVNESTELFISEIKKRLS